LPVAGIYTAIARDSRGRIGVVICTGGASGPLCVKKVFLGDGREVPGPLMRFVRGNVEDHFLNENKAMGQLEQSTILTH